MGDELTVNLTLLEYIQRLSKELNMEGAKGLVGNESELIALVRNCQFLYDRNLPDFKNIQKKSEAWEAIASVFEVTVGDAQQRWKSMRDTFNKFKKNDGSTKNISCPYYDEMKFLEPYILGRRTRLTGVSNVSEHLNSDDENSKDKESACLDNLKVFINHIRNSPILYNHKYSGSSYSKQRIESWVDISKAFGVPVKECLARWRNLRERYSRERRLIRSGASGKKWELFDELSFLDKHVKARRKYTYTRMVPTNTSDQNICYVVTSSPNSTAIDSSFLKDLSTKKEVPIEDVEFFDVSSDITSSPTNLFSEGNSLSHIHSSDSTPNESVQNKPDEDDLFGQTIAAELKRLSCPRKKIKLKADIYRLLYENTCE